MTPCALQDAALSFLEGMAARYGIKPEARHVTYVVAGLAKATNFDDASSLIDAAGNRGWGRNAGATVLGCGLGSLFVCGLALSLFGGLICTPREGNQPWQA